MILGFKKQMPDGTETNFKEKIYAGVGLIQGYMPKLHSIREGERWSEGDIIHMAYGVRTKHYEQFNKGISELSTCISVQEIFMTYDGALEITIDDSYMYFLDVEKLIANDGLTRSSFINWFFPSKKDYFSGQIIHWTNLKY